MKDGHTYADDLQPNKEHIRLFPRTSCKRGRITSDMRQWCRNVTKLNKVRRTTIILQVIQLEWGGNSSSIPPVNTVQHGGQAESLWDRNYRQRGFNSNSSSIPPVNTVQHGGQAQSLWDRNYRQRGFNSNPYAVHQATQCNMAVRPKACVTVTIDSGASTQIPQAFHQSTQYNMAVRPKACVTVTTGGGVQSSMWNPLHESRVQREGCHLNLKHPPCLPRSAQQRVAWLEAGWVVATTA